MGRTAASGGTSDDTASYDVARGEGASVFVVLALVREVTGVASAWQGWRVGAAD